MTSDFPPTNKIANHLPQNNADIGSTYAGNVDITRIAKLSPFGKRVLERLDDPVVSQNSAVGVTNAVFRKIVSVENV